MKAWWTNLKVKTDQNSCLHSEMVKFACLYPLGANLDLRTQCLIQPVMKPLERNLNRKQPCTNPASHHISSHPNSSHHITRHQITRHYISSHPRHITSHRMTSHLITLNHITPNHFTSHHITLHFITSNRITSQQSHNKPYLISAHVC